MSANPKRKFVEDDRQAGKAPALKEAKTSPEKDTPEANERSKFRVVSHAGNRYAFKLESVFWQILQLAADAKKKRIGAYIADILNNAKHNDNKTSSLRTHAAEWVCKQLFEATSRMISPRVMEKIVAASPVPALAMDRDNRIIGQNTPFLDLLRNLAGDHDISDLGTIRVKFARDISLIRASAKTFAGPYSNEKISIRSDIGEWSFSSRVVNIQSTQGNSIGLLLFITN